MSEIEAMHYCPHCEQHTLHLFAGSGTKGSCMRCGNDLPPNVRLDFNRVISANI